MPNMTMPAPPKHHDRHRLHQRRHLRQQAERQHDQRRRCGDPSRTHAGDADEADVLRERRVGEGVEDAAEDGADTVGAQAAGDRRLIDLPPGHFAEREKHPGRLDHHDHHHDAHGDDRDQT
jgi:hypothetical protein